jgi:hypothetical protein
MGLVVAASLAVQLAVLFERLGGTAFRDHLAQLVTGADLVMVNRSLPAVNAAALLLEGLALYWAAARQTQLSPLFLHRAAAAVAAGAVAAAGVNTWRVLQAASSSSSAGSGSTSTMAT